MINEKQARKYCKEDLSKIKNYDLAIADNTQTWDLHHMTETWWNCSAKDLIKNECYYHRKACELIFLTPKEHRRLHMKGKHHTEETRRKLSEASKGDNNPFFGKHHSEETRMKISESMKGENHPFFGKHHTEEARNKMSDAHKGAPGFWKGKHRSEETRRKISEAAKRRLRKENV